MCLAPVLLPGVLESVNSVDLIEPSLLFQRYQLTLYSPIEPFEVVNEQLYFSFTTSKLEETVQSQRQ